LATSIFDHVERERLIGVGEFFGPFQIDLHDQDHIGAWRFIAPDLRQAAILS
jgi:hypothetical protein